VTKIMFIEWIQVKDKCHSRIAWILEYVLSCLVSLKIWPNFCEFLDSKGQLQFAISFRYSTVNVCNSRMLFPSEI
jgi:hypothetical protein